MIVATAIGMFSFAVFIMPPLYEVFCEITGLNGKYTDGRIAITEHELADQKTGVNEEGKAEAGLPVKIQFLADETTDVPWPFYPKTRSLTIEPGTIHQVFFRVENPKAVPVIAQAIPSISPAQASLYLKKTQCFCFNHQPLAPFEGKDMGVVFYVDPEIPEGLREVTLSYRLYDITDRVEESPEVSTTKGGPVIERPAHQPAMQSAKGDTPNV
jgi:cytochrome c oxidase assembly protein subunit 11